MAGVEVVAVLGQQLALVVCQTRCGVAVVLKSGLQQRGKEAVVELEGVVPHRSAQVQRPTDAEQLPGGVADRVEGISKEKKGVGAVALELAIFRF